MKINKTVDFISEIWILNEYLNVFNNNKETELQYGFIYQIHFKNGWAWNLSLTRMCHWWYLVRVIPSNNWKPLFLLYFFDRVSHEEFRRKSLKQNTNKFRLFWRTFFASNPMWPYWKWIFPFEVRLQNELNPNSFQKVLRAYWWVELHLIPS